MLVSKIQEFDRLALSVNNQDTRTFGVQLIRMVEKLGIFAGEISKHRVQDDNFDSVGLVKSLVNVQLMFSTVYAGLKKRNNLISDNQVYLMLDKNYQSLGSSNRNIDYVWLFFKIMASIGDINKSFNIRTSGDDDKHRTTHLTVAQSYIFPELDGDDFDTFISNTFDAELLEWKNTIPEYKEPKVEVKAKKDNQPQITARPSDAPKVEPKPQIVTARPVGEPVSPPVTITADNMDTPPLPPQNVLSDLMSNLIPNNDNVKVESGGK